MVITQLRYNQHLSTKLKIHQKGVVSVMWTSTQHESGQRHVDVTQHGRGQRHVDLCTT